LDAADAVKFQEESHGEHESPAVSLVCYRSGAQRMKRVCLAAILFILSIGVGLSPAQDQALVWPRFRGPDGQGAASSAKIPTSWSEKENLLWKKSLPGPGTSSPIVVGKHIYLTYFAGVDPARSDDLEKLSRHLLCLSLDGETVWDKVAPSILPEQTRIREGHGYVSATPVCDGERLYVFFGRSGVFAFDMAGKQLWQQSVGTGLNGWGSAASPILHKDLVIVNASVESESLVALDKDTGKERWRAKGMRESWNTPILVKTPEGKTELVVAIFGKVLGFNPDTGKQLWSCATDIPWYMVPSIVHNEGVVYCIGGRNGGGALAVKTGGTGDVTKTHRLWAIKKGSNVCSPVFHKGHLYWANDILGIFYCVQADSGKVVYEERVDRPDQFYASSVLVGDRLLHVGRDGATFVLPAAPEFKILAKNDLSDRSMFNASPAVFGNRLLLRSDRHLFCVGEK